MAADAYCYDGSDLLRNLLDIRDHAALQAYEHLLTTDMAASALAFATSEPHPTFETLTGIHYLLFGELYDWAGKPRTVAMSRNSAPFMAPPIDGEAVTRTVLDPFEALAPTVGDDNGKFAELLGDVWSKLNFCHPFREGNGRATQLFVTALAHRHGRDIDWVNVSRSLDHVAGMASQRGNASGFVHILQSVLRPFDPSRPASFWRQDGR